MTTEEMRKIMIEGMKAMKKACENSKSCKNCPFDKYCDESVTPDRYEIEEN